MFFRQFYDNSLAQASYLIGCQATGEAVVIDPLRDIRRYLETATAEGLRITHVTETHIHADFVSGARELHAATGARLLLSAEGGPDWQYRFASTDNALLLHDGDHFMVGNIRLDVMHTPGHTPEHLSFVVTDTPRAAGPMGILTGDFVFVGDVGRPDLLERAAGIANTMEAGARALFRSLSKFRLLPDHLQVWPAHGAGSACGKALGAVPSSTVGYEKLSNWGVAETSEELFVQQVLAGQPEPPRYFADMKRINRDGPALLSTRPHAQAISADRVMSQIGAADSHHWFIDLRTAGSFAQAHIPGTVSIPRSRSFSTWVGSLIPVEDQIILLSSQPASESASNSNQVSRETSEETARFTAPTDVQESIAELTAIGYDRIVGWAYASDVIAAWEKSGRGVGSIRQVSANELADQLLPTIDVRGLVEWDSGHLPHATHVPLGSLPAQLKSLPAGPFVVQCQSGARSAIATSLLHRAGRTDALNLTGGFLGWRDAGLTVATGTPPAVDSKG